MSLPKIKTRLERLPTEDLHELLGWLQALIVRRETEEEEPIPVKEGREMVEERKEGGVTLRLEYVRCGKENCRCVRDKAHGPYWYAYFRRGGKVRSKYIGKKKPGSG